MNRRMPQVAGHGAKMPRLTEAAVGALLTSSSIGEAASACGVGERTLRNWLARPEFRTAFDAARRQVLDHTLTRLQAVAGEALEALLSVVRDANAPPAVKVAAARGLLDTALKVRSSEDFEARLRALEDAQREEHT